VKKKILVLVAVLLCFATLLCSCGTTSMKFKKIVDKKAEFLNENPTLTATAVVDIKGEIEEQAGDLVVFEGVDDNDNTVWTVYNVATGATVWTATESETVSYMVMPMEQWDTTLINIIKATAPASADGDMTYEVSLCDINGNAFWTKSGTEEMMEDGMEEPYMALDLIGIDGQMFRIADDGSVSKVFDYSPFAELPEVDYTLAGYYYEVNGIAANVYDSNLNLITVVKAPAYAADSGRTFVLNNGNVLLQYRYLEDALAEDYTYIDEDGEKYTVVTQLINARNGDVKDLDTEYLFMQIVARDMKGVEMEGALAEMGLNKKIDNVAISLPIENGRVSYDEYSTKLLSLSNKGKVEGTLDGAIENQFGEFEMVAPGRWIVANMAGQAFLLNEKGKVLGEVTALMSSDDDSYTLNYILMNNKIYDWDLNEKLDLATLKLDDILFCTDEGVVFEDEDGAIIMAMADGSTKTLIAKDATNLSFYNSWGSYYRNGLFVILDTSDMTNVKATAYNAAGNAIYTAEKVVSATVVHVADSNNNVLIAISAYDAESNLKTTYVLAKA